MRKLLCLLGLHAWSYNGARLISNVIDAATGRRPVMIVWICTHCPARKEERV